MEDDMAVDIELWFILAAIAGWIYLGCMMTRGSTKSETLRTRFHQH
jgi:hypothetical protein